MKNPFGDQEIPGSYRGLRERMYKKVSADVTDQVVVMLLTAYEKALTAENIVLSRVERKRMLSQISKQILEDLNKRLIDGGS